VYQTEKALVLAEKRYRIARIKVYAAGVISTSFATVVASGTGSPNSRRVWMCPEIASRIFRSVSSNVLPLVTQPGKSGTYAAQLVSAGSKITAYFLVTTYPPDPQPSESISTSLWGVHHPDARG
jgi:hypothetical protein